MVYRGVYPGVELAFHARQGQLEYDFVVAPGGDPSVITFVFPGADRVQVDDHGDLVVTAGGVDVRQTRPDVYQEHSDGRRAVDGGYDEAEAHNQVLQFYEEGELPPNVWLNMDKVFPLDDIALAIEAARSGALVKPLVRIRG